MIRRSFFQKLFTGAAVASTPLGYKRPSKFITVHDWYWSDEYGGVLVDADRAIVINVHAIAAYGSNGERDGGWIRLFDGKHFDVGETFEQVDQWYRAAISNTDR